MQDASECGAIKLRFHCDGSIGGGWPRHLVVPMGSWITGIGRQQRCGRVVGYRGGELLIEGPQGMWMCSFNDLEESEAHVRFETWRCAPVNP